MRISDWSSDVCSSDLGSLRNAGVWPGRRIDHLRSRQRRRFQRRGRVPAGRTVLARGRFRRAPAQCLFLRHRELPPYDLQEHVRPAAGFDATATIERIDFDLGMFVPNVSDEVQLRITNEASVPKKEN